MAIDLGTGDGAYVLRTAAAQERALVIGFDADASRMAAASRRAARPTRKGGLPNALFGVAAVESLPGEVDGLADAVTVHLPWGSLLRAAATPEPWYLDAIHRITKKGSSLSLLFGTAPRDGLDLPPLTPATADRLARCYRHGGFQPTTVRPATADDIRASHSSWAKRLSGDSSRALWLLRFER